MATYLLDTGILIRHLRGQKAAVRLLRGLGGSALYFLLSGPILRPVQLARRPDLGSLKSTLPGISWCNLKPILPSKS